MERRPRAASDEIGEAIAQQVILDAVRVEMRDLRNVIVVREIEHVGPAAVALEEGLRQIP
jgi:hypothetical protein